MVVVGAVERLLLLWLEQVSLAYVGARVGGNIAQDVHPARHKQGLILDSFPGCVGCPLCADDDVCEGIAPGGENRGVGGRGDGFTGAGLPVMWKPATKRP